MYRPPSDQLTAVTQAAERAIAYWPVPAPRLEFVSWIENAVFRVNAADGLAYVLRLHRPGYHTRTELESEQRWTEALNASGIGAPTPIRTRDGRRYIEVEIPARSERRLAGLAIWVDGEPMHDLIDGSETPDRMLAWFTELGRLAATIHEQAAEWRPPAGFVRHAFDVDGLTGETPFWGRFWEHPALADADRRQIAAAREQRPQSGAAIARLRCFGLHHGATPGFLRQGVSGRTGPKEHSI